MLFHSSIRLHDTLVIALRKKPVSHVMAKEFDVAIFGASGFTGKRVAKFLAEANKSGTGKPLKLAISGRDRSRLEAILPPGAAGIVVADVNNEIELIELASKSRLVLDCVGPFRFYGEPVVKACIQGKADYLDITGEPEFMERIELKYHDQAADAGVLVISAAAFDSVPADLGTVFAVDTLRSAGYLCTSVEEVLTIKSGPQGMAGHFATYESAVHGIASAGALRKLRKQYTEGHAEVKKLVGLGTRPERHEYPFWHSREGRWALPFPGSDASVVRRSQRLQVQGVGADRPTPGGPKDKVPVLPVHFSAYFTVPSLWSAFLFVVYGGIVTTLARWGWGRKLLLALPGLFTRGMFSHQGPTEEQMANTSFIMNFYAKGYSREKLPLLFASVQLPGAPRPAPPPKHEAEAIVRVAGPEPGYVATPKLLMAAALTTLEDRSSMPSGGVYTPAAAFGKTKLIERCKDLGIQFTVVEPPHKVA